MVKLKSILIVDDDSDDRSFFIEAIAQSSPDVEVMEAEDGEIALSLLKNSLQKLPDYIFLDLNMPRKNGKSVLTDLKRDFRLKHIPVYIFSTSSDPQDRQESIDLGANSFITKPFALCDWVSQVGAILATKN
ncbi:response regulator [Algoriphagus vanfongensis]|uniref:response regulator n=1 Tax=Algoriphagus vanfongensis TaxID=426371 RepID=UPI0004169B11|nr:response regulator [Algoriphagus vanfongensis]